MADPEQDRPASGSVIVRAGQWPVAIFLDPDADEIVWFASEELADAALALANQGDADAARGRGRIGEPILS